MRKRKPTKSPYLVVRQSRIHSRGVFARKDIPAGKRIIEYVGEKITRAEADRRAEIPMERHAKNPEKHGAVYLFEINSRHDIDGDVPYNTARFINHSCDPNCETDVIKGRVWVISLKEIKRGEEVTYNYGYLYDDYEDHKCNCRTDRCMGYILHEDDWPKLRRKLTRLKNLRKKGKKFPKKSPPQSLAGPPRSVAERRRRHSVRHKSHHA